MQCQKVLYFNTFLLQTGCIVTAICIWFFCRSSADLEFALKLSDFLFYLLLLLLLLVLLLLLHFVYFSEI